MIGDGRREYIMDEDDREIGWRRRERARSGSE